MPPPPSNPKCEYYGCIPSTAPGRSALESPHFNLLERTTGDFVPTVYAIDDLPPPPWDCLRVVMISDTHELHRDVVLPLGDLLLHCGDVQLGFWPFHRPRKQLFDFFEWFRGQPHPVKVFIGGNHDRLLRRMTVAEVRRHVAPALYLHNESCVVEPLGLRLYGSPRSIENSKLSPNTAFQSERAWSAFPAPVHAAAADTAADGVRRLQRGAPLTVRLEGPTAGAGRWMCC
ncbi:metallophosphoesterase domain-containing protein [Strigomonas culicis]|uniref:Metallophosphoesterase domain-containing protein n=1 Tax=Strigomonas culicis TaxID=28005 RepID=S9TGS7_9TRYP|nr:metallophosphoesterase domain-containing protein [Strigomonas culicis]|eukprot:EPY16089.1 metallophosphoesterase domain-containing protein [Strigomonas culicis]